MSITKLETRQYPLSGIVRFDLADLSSGVAVDIAALLQNETITGGALVIETAFNSGTSDVISIGDEDSATRYLSAQDVKSAAGRFAFTLTGLNYAGANTLRLVWTGAGTAATAGEGYVEFTTVREGRGNETV